MRVIRRLTVKEYSKHSGKKPQTIYKQIERGKFPLPFERCACGSGFILIEAKDCRDQAPTTGEGMKRK